MDLIRKYWSNGTIKCEEYINNRGQLHNVDGPAGRWWYKSGQIKYEEYYINGKLHNVDGPAARRWYESGQIRLEEYSSKDRLHNYYGPARREWYRSGQIKCRVHCENGRPYNIKGPAYCRWDKSGKIIEECYYLIGKKVDKDKWRNFTKSAEILRAISLLPYPIAVKVGYHYCRA
jgi:antitoxin component YwqK of YwqJK toxin-antitoxin module